MPNVDWLLSGVHAARSAMATGTRISSAGRSGTESFETRCIWELYVKCGLLRIRSKKSPTTNIGEIALQAIEAYHP